MDFYVEILDGQLKGSRKPLRAGMTIGRRDCDLNIEDSKISHKHARLEKRADGRLWLIDNGSSNRIRVGSEKVVELALEPGVSFRLGRTNFKVFESAAGAAEPSSSKWRKTILELTEKGLAATASTKRRDVAPFRDPLKLSFNRGLQSGQVWVLGYGPREIGASSVDLPLFEPGVPNKCFSIYPKEDDAVLKVHEDARGKILLNGRAVETAFIRPGDVLEIGNTRIEITFEG